MASLLGWLLTSIRGNEAKLFTNTAPFAANSEPTITVTSPECGDSPAPLDKDHTAEGANRFPALSWSLPPTLASEVQEYILLVEGPDSPLPDPSVHGIYYSIPKSTTSIGPSDFEVKTEKKLKFLSGGFKYGKNRRGTIWMGPRPVSGHGEHRYFFQVVALGKQLGAEVAGRTVTRESLEKAIKGKVIGWGVWIGLYERRA
ncbi:hypothetical protein MMC28_006249 [Mycoblastus sanguinarius]|nr:hypothetical protein [Mycoblastus sanguinarius]